MNSPSLKLSALSSKKMANEGESQMSRMTIPRRLCSTEQKSLYEDEWAEEKK